MSKILGLVLVYVLLTVSGAYAQPPNAQNAVPTCTQENIRTCIGGSEPGRRAWIVTAAGGYTCVQDNAGTCVPLSDRTDIDMDGLYETAYIWDADGDGSGGLITCTALDNPVPACKVAGELVYLDGADDINCAIHGCGYGQMELTGTLRLPEAVVASLPCWDVGAWLDDPTRLANPVTGCPATGINDPRGSCQPGGKTGTTTRSDSAAGDAAVLASCAQDAEGNELFSISLQNWQGTLEGAGTDNRENDVTALVARGAGRTRGTTIAYDTGNSSTAWFSTSGFNRQLNMGMDPGNGPGAMGPLQNGTTAGGSATAKGWGNLRGFSTINLQWHDANNGSASVCVCNHATDCDNASGLASATGWVSTLVAGDRLMYPTNPSPQTTAGYAFVETIFRDYFDPGGCGSDGYVQLRFGVPLNGYAAADFYPFAFNFGMLPTGSVASTLIAPTSNYWTNRATIANVTIEAQDWYEEPGGRCTCEDLYSDSLETSGNCPGSATVDLDCDTNPQIAMLGGGKNLVHDVVFKNWHHFSVDGGPHPGKSYFRDTESVHGHGYAFTDDSYGWEWDGHRIANTLFSGQPFGGFFSYTSYKDLEFENVAVPSGALFGLGPGAHGIRVDGVTTTNTVFDHAVKLDCGARDNEFRNFQLRGSNARPALGRDHAMITLECASALTNTGFCGAEGEWLDRDGSGTDYWCDNSIRDNVFQNFSYYGNSGMPSGTFRFQSIVLATDVITIETGVVLDIGECSGPWFVFDGGLTPNTVSPAYAFNVDRAAGTFQLSSSSACSSAVNFTAGSTSPATSQMNIQTPNYASTAIRLISANGQENAIVRNHFDQIRMFSPRAAPTRSAGYYGMLGNFFHSLLAVNYVGTGSTNVEELLWWNTLTNSYVDDGPVVGQCTNVTGLTCTAIRQLQSAAFVRGSNNTSGGATMWSTPTYDGLYKQILFGGDLPAATDTTWWLPPMATLNATTVAADDRGSRTWSPTGVSAAFGIAGVPEDAALVTTVDEPVTAIGDPPLIVEGMSCLTTGDLVASVAFTLQAGGVPLNGGEVTCTITPSTGYENYCSIAPLVATGAAPLNVIAANAALAVQANNGAGDNTTVDALCTVYTHPRL